jgi:hypothetical protein
MGEVTCRPYRLGDEVAINDGFNRVFGRARSLAEWRWKFALDTTTPWIMVAVDGEGRIVASYSAIVVPMRLGGRPLSVGQPVDVYSVPEVRGTRAFTTCFETFCAQFGGASDLPLIYGFPGGRHYAMGLKSLRYELLRPVGYWRRQARRRRLRLPLSRTAVRHGFDAGAADELWRRAAPRYPFATIRDGGWLRRRFTGRPGVEYEHLAVRVRGTVRAWGVVAPAAGTLRLAELVWDGESTRTLAALDGELDALADRRGCEQVETWLSGDPEAERALESLGWSRCEEPNDLHLVIRSFDETIDSRAMAERFYLTMGDADLV